MDKQSDSKCVMVFCAHPDDEALGAGGTLALYSRQGIEVVVVLFTDGESSHPWEKPEHVTKTRRAEVRDAGDAIGISKIIHLGLRDGKLTDDIKKPIVRELLLGALKQYKPQKVFTHARQDMLYPDHVAVHKVTLAAIDEYNKTAEQPTEVYTFNVWGFALIDRNDPQLTVDISSTFDNKRKALLAFKSQRLALYQLWPTVFVKAIVNGLKSNKKYAENFYKIR
jgi:LmbE family N-acetylglucosaminyl deacetylase